MNNLITQNAEKFEEYIDKNGPLIGFDLGTKTIGVAVSDISRTIATPITIIKRKKFLEDLEKIKDLEKQYPFVGIILGLPLNMNGTEGPRCQSTRSFAKKLSQITNHHICLWDERLSTIAAEKSLISSDISRKSRSQIIDKIAACYILQGFLNRLKNL
ncbi:MAG: Holliday junction resolvase RuvX [Paracoccaceae bacterium]|tara:strand:+ start:414 stop:887 length:474 start_codon:yes stop_codon:yes gene_type:complete